MPTVTLTAEADAAAASFGGAGVGAHLPVGYWGSAQPYRAILRFPQPAGWASMTKITSAVLHIFVSDHQHVGVMNAQLYARMQSEASLWTKSAGTQSCESGFSAGNNTLYADMAATTTNQVAFNSGSTANLERTPSVTAMVEYMRANQYAKIVIAIHPQTSSDYAEFWSIEKGGTYDAKLVITYETTSPPTAPTLVDPAAGLVIDTQTPQFSWVHNDPQGDPQVNADIKVVEQSGPTVYTPFHPAVGSDQFATMPFALTRGLTYSWQVATYDASGIGTFSPTRLFTVRGAPVVTIDSVRRMAYSAKAPSGPRLVVQWTADQPVASYRVTTASGYDSGPLTDGLTSHTIERALTDNVAENVTVSVIASAPSALTGSASRSFTPRFGLTTHRRDLTVAPASWSGYAVTPSSQPAGATLQVEFGSDPNPNAAPVSGWFASLGSVPYNRYLFWRAWFIPSATAGPTLDKIIVTSASGAAQVDKWGTTRDTPGLVAPWSIVDGESVYGTRSMHAVLTDAAEHVVYAYKVRLRANRTYILTGLMKSDLNSGAHFRLEDAAGNILLGGGMVLPVNSPVQSDKLIGTLDWYDSTRRDTNRYKTPTYQAPASDIDAYVVLAVQGVAGAQAWFDAIKLEESSVATPWSPGAIGATVVDAGGVQIDGNKGGVFRYKGTDGAARSVVGGGTSGLLFAGDTELASPSTGVITVAGSPIATTGPAPIIRVFSASAVWAKPAGLAYAIIEAVGAGGAGGGAVTNAAGAHSKGGGGGAGGYSRRVVTAAALGATEAVTIGAGGAPGAAGSGGGTGGVTSFGAWCAANGGLGGAAATTSASGFFGRGYGGAGGAPGTGDFVAYGAGGGEGVGGLALSTSGRGGDSIFGQGGASQSTGSATQSAAGSAGIGYGGGGAGAVTAGTGAAVAGGAGADGVVIVTEFYGVPPGTGVLPVQKSGPAFPSSPVLNDQFLRTDVAAEYMWNGTLWLPLVPAVQSGVANVTIAAGNGTAVITFPRAFATPPIVVASTGQGPTFYFASASLITATGCTLALRDIRDAQTGAGTLPVNWVASGTWL